MNFKKEVFLICQKKSLLKASIVNANWDVEREAVERIQFFLCVNDKNDCIENTNRLTINDLLN